MTLLLIILVTIFLTIVYFGYPITRAIRVSKHILEEAVPYEQHPQDVGMRILVAGDSTGVGAGAKDPKDSIAGRIGSDFLQSDIRNISESGITLEILRKKLYALTEQHYDLMVIQIGANDVTSFTPRKKVLEELKLVLDYAGSHASSVVLLTAGNIGLSPVFKAPLSQLISFRTLMVRALFQKESQNRPTVTYVDLYESAEDDIFSTDINKYYAPDFFHPSGHGYGVWYEDVQKAVK